MTFDELLRGVELKPCPFCNSKSIGAENVSAWIRCECANCFAKGGKAKTLESAVRIWNTRFTGNTGKLSAELAARLNKQRRDWIVVQQKLGGAESLTYMIIQAKIDCITDVLVWADCDT